MNARCNVPSVPSLACARPLRRPQFRRRCRCFLHTSEHIRPMPSFLLALAEAEGPSQDHLLVRGGQEAIHNAGTSAPVRPETLPRIQKQAHLQQPGLKHEESLHQSCSYCQLRDVEGCKRRSSTYVNCWISIARNRSRDQVHLAHRAYIELVIGELCHGACCNSGCCSRCLASQRYLTAR